MLQQKLAQLEAAMEQRGLEGERRLKALRQENEKLRQEALKRWEGLGLVQEGITEQLLLSGEL